ncbi:MAG: FKBP-type peptidyl-prolyl cis-trans isomerase [Bdellovibrio sp.]
MTNHTVECEDLFVGDGPEAVKGALLLVHYEGFLEDGTKFDSTSVHGRPYQFVVGSQKVIKGWSLGVTGMKVGGKRKIWIPAELAYGDRQIGPHIKPHSNLIFFVELLECRPRD